MKTIQDILAKLRGRNTETAQETEEEVLTEEQERLIYAIAPSIIPVTDEFSELF